MTRVAYLTAGTVGAGHWMRGLALHRALVRGGARGRFLLASPSLDLPAIASANDAGASMTLEHRAIAVDSSRVVIPEEALASDAARALDAFGPELVVVDLFWLPFLHLVRSLRAPAWLLLRRCPPAWFVGPPALRFDASAFARVIWTEPCADGPIERAARVEPIVIANPDEVVRDPALRVRLGAASDRPLALVAHGGRAGEIDALESLAQERYGATHVIARADLHAPGAPFPLAPWLPQADAIVAAAGYNLAWETVWLGVRARATLVPFPRSIDDQATRAVVSAQHTMRDNGADQLARDALSGG